MSLFPDKALKKLQDGFKNGLKNGVLDLTLDEITDEMVPELCTWLAKFDGKIKELILVNNNITSKGASALFQAAKKIESLQAISINDNKINDDSMPHLGNLIENNYHLKKIDIGRNQISDNGIQMIKDHIIGNPTLETLDLSRNSGITDASVPLFIEIAKNSALRDITLRNTTVLKKDQSEINKYLQIPLTERGLKIPEVMQQSDQASKSTSTSDTLEAARKKKRNEKSKNESAIQKSSHEDGEDTNNAFSSSSSSSAAAASSASSSANSDAAKPSEQTARYDYRVETAKTSKSGKPKLLTTAFAKDEDDMVHSRKAEAVAPIDMTLRNKPIIAPLLPSLDFPKRPKWTRNTTPSQLTKMEEDGFKKWLNDIHGKYTLDQLSPFEHNLEVWRQLWRVLERSDLILIVADVRNPLLHIPRDLYHFVVNTLKLPLVVALTKVDLVDEAHVQKWIKFLKYLLPEATYIPFAGKAQHTYGKGGVGARRKILTSKATKVQISQLFYGADVVLRTCLKILGDRKVSTYKNDADVQTGVEEEFNPYADSKDNVFKIGIVGHPNCGKSSLLNAIVGRHVVSVSRQPGHTKHWQTHFVYRDQDWTLETGIKPAATLEEIEAAAASTNQKIVAQLCDSPGLIFPVAWIGTEENKQHPDARSFERPRHIFELCGLYPISQIRETFSAIRFLAERLPVEKIYNLKIDEEDYGPIDQLSPYAICGALADQKGFTLARGGGAPDFHRAGQMILYDCVDGVVLLKFEPPNIDVLKKTFASLAALSLKEKTEEEDDDDDEE